MPLPLQFPPSSINNNSINSVAQVKNLGFILDFFSYTFLTNLAVSPISYAFKVIHLESDHVILSPQLPPLFCCATFWLPLYLPVVCPPSYQRGPSGLLYLWLQNVLRTWFVMPLFQFFFFLSPPPLFQFCWSLLDFIKYVSSSYVVNKTAVVSPRPTHFHLV